MSNKKKRVYGDGWDEALNDANLAKGLERKTRDQWKKQYAKYVELWEKRNVRAVDGRQFGIELTQKLNHRDYVATFNTFYALNKATGQNKHQNINREIVASQAGYLNDGQEIRDMTKKQAKKAGYSHTESAAWIHMQNAIQLAKEHENDSDEDTVKTCKEFLTEIKPYENWLYFKRNTTKAMEVVAWFLSKMKKKGIEVLMEYPDIGDEDE